MEIVKNRDDLSRFLALNVKPQETVGFVPTMGALHEGHLSLVKRSSLENEHTIVSVYVNPTQFNDSNDLEKYPRNIEADIEMLEKESVDCVFLPDDQVIYPNGPQLLKIDLDGLDQRLEGAFRPGHFEGMVTVVDIFFSLLKPDRAYFGQKDFQQLQIVRKLAQKRYPNLKIVGCEIDRDENGLARSSRNTLLSPEEYQIALSIPKAVFLLQSTFAEDIEATRMELESQLNSTKGLQLEYLSISDSETLKPYHSGPIEGYRVLLAAKVGKTRLIDNGPLE